MLPVSSHVEGGLLTEDGPDKYRFLNAYMATYGQRDAPGGLSIFGYRRSEAEHFQNYWNSDESDDARE